MPGDPVAAIVARYAQGMSNTSGVQKIYEQYTELFGTNKPMLEQFFIYVKNVVHGDFGFSFSQYPRTVADVLKSAIWWTIWLQFPAIIVGWIIGNTLGALAAYLKGGFDKVLMPISIFISNFPQFGMAVILLVIFGVSLKWFPTSGGYGFDLMPSFTWSFMWSVIVHYQLPFWSIVLIAIGGQAIGMRSMCIYELGTDYVRYAKLLRVRESLIVRYMFRNAMLPQLTGLALTLGGMVGGALIAEMIFSYPGLGLSMLTAIQSLDYPVITGCTLLVTTCVLVANFTVDILIGFLDPRIRAAREGGH